MGKLIMTADDSASVRQMVAFTLKQNGYEVIEAVDGQDALTKLSTQKGGYAADRPQYAKA